jgi:hypothetical protein
VAADVVQAAVCVPVAAATYIVVAGRWVAVVFETVGRGAEDAVVVKVVGLVVVAVDDEGFVATAMLGVVEVFGADCVVAVVDVDVPGDLETAIEFTTVELD